MNFYVVVSYTLGSLTLFALVFAVGLAGALIRTDRGVRMSRLFGGRHRLPIGTAALVALTATAGSLYLSNVAGLLPCELCWFQRIFMYPLVLILGVGLFRGDRGVWRYVLPVAGVGLLISSYHVVLQYNPGLELTTCSTGTPCSMRYLAVYGFVSIPMMAGVGFLLISMLMLALRSMESSGE